eukprot:g4706.t1
MDSSSHAKREGKGAALFQLQSSRGPSVRVKSAKRNNKGQLVRGTHRRMVFRAQNADDAREWVHSIKMEIAPSPILLMLKMQRISVMEADSENANISPLSSSSSSAVSSASALTPLAERTTALVDRQRATVGRNSLNEPAKLVNTAGNLEVNSRDTSDEEGSDRVRHNGKLVTDSETSASEDDEREMRDHVDSLEDFADSSSNDGLDIGEKEIPGKDEVEGAKTEEVSPSVEATKRLMDSNIDCGTNLRQIDLYAEIDSEEKRSVVMAMQWEEDSMEKLEGRETRDNTKNEILLESAEGKGGNVEEQTLDGGV